MRATLHPQIEMPPSLIPRQTPNLATVAEVYPEPKPKDPRSTGERLMDLRAMMLNTGAPEERIERATQLVSQFYLLQKEIGEFEAEERTMRIVRLEQQFALLSQKCRVSKGDLDKCQLELAGINSRISAHQVEALPKARNLAETVESQRPKEADFPTFQETELWMRKYSEAKAGLDAATEHLYELNRAEGYARLAQSAAAKTYNSAVSEYRGVKAELAQIQQKQI